MTILELDGEAFALTKFDIRGLDTNELNECYVLIETDNVTVHTTCLSSKGSCNVNFYTNKFF